MHELGVVFQVIRTVEEVAQENSLKKIRSVTLEVGEVSTVVESYLKNCWEWAMKKQDDLLCDAELQVEQIPAVTYCEACDQTYGTVEHGKICPYCGSSRTWLLRGNEFNVTEIEGC